MKFQSLFSICLISLTCIITGTSACPLKQWEESLDESLSLHTVDVDGEILHYYLYLPSQNPIEAILIIPPLGGNHVSYLVGATWGPSEGNMTDSPLVRRARIYNFALVFAEGEKSDWYRPNNGEKKVLSCLKDANNTFLQLSSTKWFIYGFSMGGVGAITITVRNPNLFNGLFSGGGMPDLTNDVWIGYYNKTWQSNELIKTASPRQHLEVFFNRTIFLTCGFGDPIVVNYDNFSRILDNHNIRHYYGRVKGGHTYQMLLDTMNQTFIMFSHDVTGTLDDFFEGYSSPLTSTKISSTSNLDFIIPIISLIFLTIRFFDRRKNFLLLLELQDTPEFFFITS